MLTELQKTGKSPIVGPFERATLQEQWLCGLESAIEAELAAQTLRPDSRSVLLTIYTIDVEANQDPRWRTIVKSLRDKGYQVTTDEDFDLPTCWLISKFY